MYSFEGRTFHFQRITCNSYARTVVQAQSRPFWPICMANSKIHPSKSINTTSTVSKIDKTAQTMLTPTPSSRHWNLYARRMQSRAELDSASDFSITESEITFRQSFVSIESEESFFVAPNCLIESCRRLLSILLDDTVAHIVHDNVTVQIGCNVVPVFALVNGGRDRTLFTFRCVYEDCSAFLDIRKFAGADKLKWVIVGVSHCHDFSTFPSRMPRNTFTATTIREFNAMVSQGATCCDMVMKRDV